MNEKNLKISRRGFLKTASVATAGLAIPTILPSSVFGQNAPSNRVAIACIGVGAMGAFHLKALKTMKECQVVSICDVNDQKREAGCHEVGLPIEASTRDFQELLDRDDIDAVNIATPDHWHTPLAIQFMKAGKAVYLQKPVSLNVAEGRALSDCAKQYNAILQTGSQQRSSRDFRFACELVRNGYIGKITNIQVGLEKPYNPNAGLAPVQSPPANLDYDRWLGPAQYKGYTSERVIHFRGLFAHSGGYYSDWGAHHLDIVQWALGKDDSGPVKVSGQGTFQTEGIFDVPMSFTVRYTYDDGIEVVASEQFENGILFQGTEGSIFVSRERFDSNPRSLLSTKLRPDEVHLPVSANHLEDFFAAIRENRDPIVPAEVGHRSATVCHLGNISMRLNRELEWDPVNERFVNDEQANRYLSAPLRSPWNLV